MSIVVVAVRAGDDVLYDWKHPRDPEARICEDERRQDPPSTSAQAPGGGGHGDWCGDRRDRADDGRGRYRVAAGDAS